MVKKLWRLLDIEYNDPSMNLAVEEAIPRLLYMNETLNTIRFWRNSNTVVIGRFQDVYSEINIDACRRYGTSVVRRFTGGGAVYQDLGNLNYAISMKKGTQVFQGNLQKIRGIISQSVIKGLKMLGIKAKYRPPSGLFIRENKISGYAGAIKWGVFFHHGTLLVNSNLKILSDVLASTQYSTSNKYVRSIPSKTTTFKLELGTEVNMEHVKTALIHGFRRIFNIEFINGKLNEREERLAKQLLLEKYSSILP